MKIKQRLGMITLTGVDQWVRRTPLQELLEHPLVEIGILYAPDRIEKDVRYPEREFVVRAVRDLKGKKSLHVCGARARMELVSGQMDEMVANVQRVQINGRIFDAKEIKEIAERWSDKTIITQHTPENAFILTDVHSKNHAVVVDESGGQGRLPLQWLAPKTKKLLGFAGGLDAENLEVELLKIARVAKPGSWIDIESALRDGAGNFCLVRAREALEIFERVQEMEI